MILMKHAELLKSIRFLVDDQGKPLAVQIGIREWRELVELLEDREDRGILMEALERLHADPEGAGALQWEKVREEWQVDAGGEE
jgi:hypothetical protein